MTDNVVSIGVSKRPSSVAGTLPQGGAALFNFSKEREQRMSGKDKDERLFQAAATIAEYEGVGTTSIRMMMGLLEDTVKTAVRHKAADWLRVNCSIACFDENDEPMGSRFLKRGRR